MQIEYDTELMEKPPGKYTDVLTLHLSHFSSTFGIFRCFPVQNREKKARSMSKVHADVASCVTIERSISF